MNENVKKRFGRKIRILRDERHLSREKLAEAVDLSAYYIGQIERGECNLTFNNMINLADVFGVEVGELFDFRF